MYKNYIIIALRTLWRDRAFSFINLAGLAAGLASVLMIMTYVRYELSYDKHYSNSPRVYRLAMMSTHAGSTNEQSISLPVGLTEVLHKEFPAIQDYVLTNKSEVSVNINGDVVKLSAMEATKDFFKVFNFPFIYGNAQTALQQQDNIVLTEKSARTYFPGVTNPVGRLLYNSVEKKNMIVSGVIKEIPANTHFSAQAIFSIEGAKFASKPLNWRAYTSIPQYVLLNTGANATEIEGRFSSIFKRYSFPPEVKLVMQPVTSIHLHSHTERELQPNSDIKYIYIFSCIAVLILLIGSINYINLTTARSLQRAREIGVRKVLGAMKKQLVIQFLSESLIFFVLCLILGAAIAKICWPMLAQVINNSSGEIPLFSAGSVALMVLVVIVFGLLSGSYPAFFISRVKTAQVLKGITKFGINVSMRKVLVGVQFVISGVLIVSTLVIYNQLKYINNARLGFDKDHLITMPFFMTQSHVGAFKNDLLQNPDIKAMSVASWETGVDFGGWASMKSDLDSTKTWQFQFIDADPDFVKTMGLNLLHGRNFSRNNAADMFDTDSATAKLPKGDDAAYKRITAARPIIVNQEALSMLNMKYKDGLSFYKGAVQGTVIGVVENFNGLTLHEKIPAVIIRTVPNAEFGQLYVRLSPQHTQQTIAFLQKKWSQYYPDHRFEFKFVDDKLQQLYSADKRLGQLFGIFATLAIVIACLGLFGLISLTVQQRVKEIGIRKVLGASIANITTLLSADFLKLVIFSMLIASPIAWYIMNKWLQDFAYHVHISWWMFAVAAGSALLIAMVTVSFQAIKAAIANPVNSLRSE